MMRITEKQNRHTIKLLKMLTNAKIGHGRQISYIPDMRNRPKATHKSLRIIEGLCELFENGSKDLKQATLIIDDIYKIAHCHSKCENPHRDWWKQRQIIFKELKKVGLI